MMTDLVAFVRRNVWPVAALALLLVVGVVYSWERIASRYDPQATEEQVVFYPLVTSGTDYRRVTYPEQVDTIRVMADTPFVLDALRSDVSFWPITREYRPDLRQRNEPITADLEIVHPDGTVEIVNPELYTIWYADGVMVSGAEFYTGDAAVERHATYVEQAREHAEASRQYQMREGEYQLAVDAWIAMAGQGVDPLPDPPQRSTEPAPEPYLSYAREPELGLVLELPAGDYTVRLRDEAGNVIEGSERSLRAFSPLDADYGYQVILAQRWTQPLPSLNPNHVVYVTEGTEVYLQPIRVEQHTAGNFGRVLSPQTVQIANDDQRVWIPVEDADEPVAFDELFVDGPSFVPDRVEERPYRVFQIPNRQFGYVIEEFEWTEGQSGVAPDFHAMKLVLDEPARATVSLSAGGSDERFGAREIRAVSPPDAAWLYLPAVLPLLVFAGVSFRRRRYLQKSD